MGNQIPITWLFAILLLFAAVFYGLIVWQRAWVTRSYEFLGEVKAELKKVTWPGKKEVQSTTIVVIVTVFFFGIYLQVIDVIVGATRNWIFGLVR